MSMKHGTFTARKITIETDDSQVVIDRDARVMLADRSVHGEDGIGTMLREYDDEDCDMVMVIGIEMPERHKDNLRDVER